MGSCSESIALSPAIRTFFEARPKPHTGALQRAILHATVQLLNTSSGIRSQLRDIEVRKKCRERIVFCSPEHGYWDNILIDKQPHSASSRHRSEASITVIVSAQWPYRLRVYIKSAWHLYLQHITPQDRGSERQLNTTSNGSTTRLDRPRQHGQGKQLRPTI